jgi:hypothetical protein
MPLRSCFSHLKVEGFVALVSTGGLVRWQDPELPPREGADHTEVPTIKGENRASPEAVGKYHERCIRHPDLKPLISLDHIGSLV